MRDGNQVRATGYGGGKRGLVKRAVRAAGSYFKAYAFFAQQREY
jgi:hypothetical protein